MGQFQFPVSRINNTIPMVEVYLLALLGYNWRKVVNS